MMADVTPVGQKNTKSGLPHVSDFVVRDRFFKAHLLAARVLYRGPGQCWHTYASQLLTTEIASIDWITEQMRHTNGKPAVRRQRGQYRISLLMLF